MAIPFITGDQPVVNPLGTGLKAPTEMVYFYPPSPIRAVHITEAPAMLPVAR